MIAERFGKQHKDVIRSINELYCSDEFRERNFAPSSYTSLQNKQIVEYLVTKDGFSFLVMGFTGEFAGYWKEQYIKAFNDMEAELNKPKETTIPTNFVEALTLALEQAKELEVARPKAEFVDAYVEKGALQDIAVNHIS